jgi:chromosome segregation ATPase
MSNKKKIKKLSATNKELSKEVTVLRSKLTRTEAMLARTDERAKRWKTETAAARTAAARSDTRAEKLQRKLDRAGAALEPVKASAPAESAATGRPAAEPTAADGVTVPDPTWTVAQLRAEARARGVTGLSGKPKAQILAALTKAT